MSVSSPTSAARRATADPTAALNAAGVAAGAAAAASAARVAIEDAPLEERAFAPEDDATLSTGELMGCGALAGMTEHLVMFPIDTVKTRIQSYAGVRDYAGMGVFRTMRQILQREGMGALWRGAGAVALSAGPAHALYFASYESGRAALDTRGVPFAPAIAGVGATVLLDGVMTPWDVVKQRMQLAPGRYTNAVQCARVVYMDLGLGAFFAGFKATLVMNIPYTAVYFSVYEGMKNALYNRNRTSSAQFSALDHCFAGAAAGGAAAAITTPLDVVRTRLQTQGEVGARRYRGLADALTAISLEEGAPGLLRGVRARILFHAPAAAVCWTTYEFCKHLLRVGEVK